MMKSCRKRFNTVPIGNAEPIKTNGDSKCLYQALSRILKGTRKHWVILKVGVFSKGVMEDCLIVDKVVLHYKFSFIAI